MNTKNIFRSAAFPALAILAASSTFAHRQWLLPSTSVLSGEDQWISVEGAISNDLFYPNHVAIPLAATSATSPSGEKLELQNSAQGKIRSTFELQLEEQGTYQVTTLNNMMFTTWKENGESKRARYTPEQLADKDLSEMEELKLSRYISRVETIVTCGEPTDLTPDNLGLEFAFMTHPNDLFSGETATFQLLLDGEPLPDTEVTVIKGSDRFRNSVNEIVVTSNEDGEIEITWPEPGRYWINTSTEQPDGEFKGYPTRRRAAYTLTVEVLPE